MFKFEQLLSSAVLLVQEVDQNFLAGGAVASEGSGCHRHAKKKVRIMRYRLRERE